MRLVHLFYTPVAWNGVAADTASLSALRQWERCNIRQIFMFTENIPLRAKVPIPVLSFALLQAVVTVRSLGTCRSSPYLCPLQAK